MALLSKEKIAKLVEVHKSWVYRRNFIDSFFSTDANTPPLFEVHDEFTLRSEDFDWYKGADIQTTVGRFLIHVVIMGIPSEFAIPYINEVFGKKHERAIAKNITEVYKVDKQKALNMYCLHINAGYHIGSFPGLAIPSLSIEGMGTSKEAKNAFKDGVKRLSKDGTGKDLTPEQMAEIEREAVRLDKEFVEDDPAKEFYYALGKKAFDVHRKSMFIGAGGAQAFDDAQGTYDFNRHSLEDGLVQENVALYANQAARGAFNRGSQTQIGGNFNKVIGRIISGCKFTADDCGTKGTETVTIGRNLSVEEQHGFIGTNMVVNGKSVLITEDNIKSIEGKTVKLRSPLYCLAPNNGFCYACMGPIYKELGVVGIGIRATRFGDVLISISMANMHNEALTSVEIVPSVFAKVIPFTNKGK